MIDVDALQKEINEKWHTFRSKPTPREEMLLHILFKTRDELKKLEHVVSTLKYENDMNKYAEEGYRDA